LASRCRRTGQFDQDAFLELVTKARAKGWTPISLGAGDRPFPGAHLTHDALLMKLGPDDYAKLLKGQIKCDDMRVSKPCVMCAR
jgi:hypothetical protein